MNLVTKLCVFFIMMLLSIASFAKDVQNKPTVIKKHIEMDFTGKWCGKWDGKFKVCLDIAYDKALGGYKGIYQWEEYIGKPMHEMEISAELRDVNTLIFNGFLVMTVNLPNDPPALKGTLIGLFDGRSRGTSLERVLAKE